MTHVRTALSLESDLFDEAEEAARDLKMTRSGVWSLAMTEFLHRRRSQTMLEEINASVGDGPDEEDRIRLHGMRRLQRRALADDPW